MKNVWMFAVALLICAACGQESNDPNQVQRATPGVRAKSSAPVETNRQSDDKVVRGTFRKR